MHSPYSTKTPLSEVISRRGNPRQGPRFALLDRYLCFAAMAMDNAPTNFVAQLASQLSVPEYALNFGFHPHQVGGGQSSSTMPLVPPSLARPLSLPPPVRPIHSTRDAAKASNDSWLQRKRASKETTSLERFMYPYKYPKSHQPFVPRLSQQRKRGQRK